MTDTTGGADRVSAPDGEVTGEEATHGEEGLVPALACDAVDLQTVLIRLTVTGDPAAVAEELPAPPLIDVHVVAGRFDVFAVGRFDDRTELNALLADLSTDPRVTAVTADTVLRTVCEHDASGLVASDSE